MTSKGYAFVDMLDRAGADRATAALDGFVIAGRMLSVRSAADKRQAAITAKAPSYRPFDRHQKTRNDEQRNTSKIKCPHEGRF